MKKELSFNLDTDKLSLFFSEEINLYILTSLQKQIDAIDMSSVKNIIMDLDNVTYMDTASAIFVVKCEEKYNTQDIKTTLVCSNQKILSTLEFVKMQRIKTNLKNDIEKKKQGLLKLNFNKLNDFTKGILSFMDFFGKLFATIMIYLTSFKSIRFKEIAFEINESAIKAIGIVALTSFLIGLVVAYQSAFQLKAYGANIFIVDMLGISILRELAPLITAIVIAGRSGSAFTAQIGAMKITQELDAMKTMGFDPYIFLVMPRIIALMITMPILIFVADIMGIVGGMIVANTDLGITTELFLERFREVVDAKHFFIGIFKGPFFAFLIASIGIYRGLVVKDDTQSIGLNTTKSVVESIFAVIVCDAFFSIAFTNLGI
jgi:phospholipid/cholesterol/gamma-HCH transport system permease protein